MKRKLVCDAIDLQWLLQLLQTTNKFPIWGRAGEVVHPQREEPIPGELFCCKIDWEKKWKGVGQGFEWVMTFDIMLTADLPSKGYVADIRDCRFGLPIYPSFDWSPIAEAKLTL